MAKIKIKDLPKDYKITQDEMKRVRGGVVNLVIKMDDVKGEATDQDHKDWILIESMSSPTGR